MRLSRLFGWLDPKPIPVTRSTMWCEPLTPWEAAFLKKHGWVCPDCEKGTLMWGPEGGCCVNVTCNHCGARFNLSMDASHSGTRLSVGTPPTVH